MSAHSGPNIVEDGAIVYFDCQNKKSFPGLPTTNLSRLDSDFTGKQYGAGNEYSTVPLIKTYDPLITTPIGSGATLVTESGGNGYHTLSGWGGGGENFLHSISCYIKPMSSITSFWIGMVNSTGKGVDFNLDTRTVNYESVLQNQYFIYEVDGYPGWIRIGVNVEGRFGGWIGGIGYNMRPYTGVAGGKPYYITGVQYEYQPSPTKYVFAQNTRGSNISEGGGTKNLISINTGSGINGSGLTENLSRVSGIVFDGTAGQSLNFGDLDYGTPGEKEGTVVYWLNITDTGNWNMFGAGGPGYYYAVDPYSRLVMMTSAKNSEGNGVNYWPTTGNVSSKIFGKPSMIVCSMKEDNFVKWYINGELELESTPPHFSYLRFKNGNFRVGQGYNTTSTQFTGTIYNASYYDRVLSDQEIKQNFNALRGRYGI